MAVFHGKEEEIRITLFTLLLLVFLVGLSGNIILCNTFRKHSSLRTVTNLIISNMAVTAIAHNLLNTPISLSNLALNRWSFGEMYCRVNGLTNSVCLFQSMFSLAVLSCSRYCCILHPTRFHAIFSKQRTLFMISLSWLLAFILSSLPLFGWSEFQWRDAKMMCNSMWKYSVSYTSFIAVTVFLLPSIAIIVIYYKIYRHIRDHQKLLKLYKFVADLVAVRRKNYTKSIFKDYQVTKLIWTLFVIFVASWVPYFGVNLVFEIRGSPIPYILDVILTWTTIFNTTCSPIIYGMVNRQFRKAFWDDINCCCKKSFERGNRRRTSRYRDTTDMMRTCPQTSRTQHHETNANGVVLCVSTV